MQSTLVGGVSARPRGAKATLYVGGLADGVNEASLHAAFIPFGEIKVKRFEFVRWGCERPIVIRWSLQGAKATNVARPSQCAKRST